MCSRRDAMLIAAGANTKDVMGLTQHEKMDIAWRLVREPEAKFTKTEIAGASGISDRTVTTMRKRWRTLRGTERELTGRWWQDRVDNVDEGGGPPHQMSDAERRKEVKAIGEKLRKAVGNVAFRDEQLFAEALDEAFGVKLRAVIDYLYGEEEWDEWGSINVSGFDAVEEDDGDEQPAF